jgi:hypothetical protein
MELVEILKALWSRRIIVAVAAVVAFALALTVLYQPGLPPQSRAQTSGAGSTEILIDAPQSTLGDLRRDITPLIARGGIFSRFLATDDAAKEIARESGVPARELTVSGPKLSIDGVPDQGAAKRAADARGTDPYLVQVQQGDELPVLSIFTSAPTARGARRLADATATALSNAVTSVQDETAVPEKRRLTIRQLGSARAGEVTDKPSPAFAVVVFLALFGLFCLAILGWPRLVLAWRGHGQPVAGDSNGFGLDRYGDDAASLSLVPIEGSFVFERPALTASTDLDDDAESFHDDGADAESGKPSNGRGRKKTQRTARSR